MLTFEIKPGRRTRTKDGWERVDRVLVNNRAIRGTIITRGRRKGADEVSTHFGEKSISGSDAWWLAARNGLIGGEEQGGL